MKRAVGYGLVVLAALGTRCALAWPFAAGFYLADNAASSAPAPHAQGYLGVGLRDIAVDEVGQLKLKDAHGAVIVVVDHDAPAGKAGLRERDVILQLNGQLIESESQLHRMLHDSPPGKTVVLLISRDGQQMTVTAQMANQEQVERQAWEQHIIVPVPQDPAPAPDTADSGFSSGSSAPAPPMRGGNSFIGTILMSPSYTGVMLEPMSKQLAQFFGVPNGAGLLVRSIVANSPAEQAGMRAGDVVLRADAKPIATPADWAKAIKNSHGQPLAVTVLRDKKEQTLTLTPDAKKRSSLEQPEQPGALAHLRFSWMPGS